VNIWTDNKKNKAPYRKQQGNKGPIKLPNAVNCEHRTKILWTISLH